ncbi:MAG: hypothetical protein C0519_12845 [Hyphomicrobium sp.]|jgi:hypothetical protein|nr:hypothetical protein [Hyphomicrobium sp.]PPD09093.1 MAG: hypothetical protein CTY28_03305 [Hyphomicrobium sp.]
MELTRHQFAYLVSTLYCAGGALLLIDWLIAPSAPGAHLPLAWHVYPVALAVDVIAWVADVSGPLDTNWPVSIATTVAAYVLAVVFCAAAMGWLISSRGKRRA